MLALIVLVNKPAEAGQPLRGLIQETRKEEETYSLIGAGWGTPQEWSSSATPMVNALRRALTLTADDAAAC
eukprot:2182894-Prymnesium_polylepis.1